MREGVAGLARHPLDDPTPAGATVAGYGVRSDRLRSGFCRDGPKPAPLRLHHRRGRRMPVEPLKPLALADWQGDEAGVLTRLHANQDAALAFGTRTREDRAYVGGRGNRFASNFKDDVAGLEPIGDCPRGINAGDDDTLRSRSGNF